MPPCSVPYCPNATAKESRVTFHEFPHETPLFLNKWLENIGRPNWRPGLRSVICSDHFEKDDFDRQGRLRIGSFPSKFPEPPFRKKKKVESDHDTYTIPSAGIAEPRQVDKMPLSMPKAADSAPKDPLLHQDVRVNVTKLMLSSNAPSVFKTSPVLVTKTKNLSNENEARVSIVKDGLHASAAAKSSLSTDAAKKRKILEESPSQNTDQIASVASSFSLRSCRICGEHNCSKSVEIFGAEGWMQDLPTLINKCLPIKISPSDPLPHHICGVCIARLKQCSQLIETCEKTNNCFKGIVPQPSSQKDKDPPIIHSRPINPKPSNLETRRVMLLEMSLKEGVPVKEMISQAIQELNLRLRPKILRGSTPEGRIMFLDLQGGAEAFPEQMKKAVSMLFPSPSNAVPQGGKNFSGPITSQNSRTASSPPNQILAQNRTTTSREESRNFQKPQVTINSAQLKTAVSSTQHPLIVHPSPSNSGVVTLLPPTSSSSLNTMINLQEPQVAFSTTNQNRILQQPSVVSVPVQLLPKTPGASSQPAPILSVPVSVLPKTPGVSSAIQLSTIAGTLNPSEVPKLVQVSPSNIIKLQSKSKPDLSSAAPAQKSPVEVELMDHDYDSHFMEDDPEPDPEDGSKPLQLSLPALIPFKGDMGMPPPQLSLLKSIVKSAVPEVSTPENTSNGQPVIDIAKMKDKVLTKISNMGNQFKLGDKIVGIILRNADSREDIQKKLQATFSNGTPVKDSMKTVSKSKERTILPKANVVIPAHEIVSSPPCELTNGGRKFKERPLDVLPTADFPNSHFDRRNARKLSLSFMWRRTGFLVSSYQKLFTWQMEAASEDSDGPNPVLTCRVCKFEAKSKGEVETHLQVHPDLQCSVCWKYFLTVGKVHEHMSVIHCLPTPNEVPKRRPLITWRLNNVRKPSLKQFQCSRCERRFKFRDALKRHVGVCKDRTPAEKAVSVKKGRRFVCSTCHRYFSNAEDLEEHTAVHTKRTSWLCDICGTVLKSASNYRSHIARHDENAHEYQYQCGICRKRFKLSHRYTDHMKKHEEHQQFICSSCGKVFKTLNGLRQHEILHGERKLQCKFCPSRFHRRDHLRIHEATHTNTNRKKKSKDISSSPGGRMFSCRFCIASKSTVVKFSAMRDLLRHYNEDHPNDRVGSIPGSKRFECDRCNRSFANSTLLRHHHMWHAGLHPYTCSHCGAGFMVKERLRNHELIHTNERPFKCQTCGKGFRSRNCLKQHKVIHKDPSEFFKCKYCDKTFSRLDNLRTHTRVHTGEKPWKCMHCHRQFRLRSECTKHIQIAHNIPANQVFENMETVIDANSIEEVEDVESESNSAESVIDAALAGITTVQDMELLIEADDLEEASDDL